jgi:isopentenyl diphosphate isomerase/L-lactate dehydrogenase-like FMN-dependent dehydrogenase
MARKSAVNRQGRWALAADGEEGVRTLITEMADELKRAMTLTGVKDPQSANKDILLPVK